MRHDVYPQATAEMSERRQALAPATHDVFTVFSRQVFVDGALPEVTKQMREMLDIASGCVAGAKGAQTPIYASLRSG